MIVVKDTLTSAISWISVDVTTTMPANQMSSPLFEGWMKMQIRGLPSLNLTNLWTIKTAWHQQCTEILIQTIVKTHTSAKLLLWRHTKHDPLARQQVWLSLHHMVQDLLQAVQWDILNLMSRSPLLVLMLLMVVTHHCAETLQNGIHLLTQQEDLQ